MNSRQFVVLLFCLLQLSAPLLAQDLPFDKLSDCDALAQVLRALQRPISRSCRSPKNQLEVRLMHHLQMTPKLSSCLLEGTPTNRLAGFSCIDLQSKGNRELVCFHPIAGSALRKYRDNYDSARTDRYKQAAANCPGTNRDASEAPNSLFPEVLYPIAKADFGFVLGLGTSRLPLARAYHGFGSVDPSLAIDTSAIEVFDLTKYEPGQASQRETDSTASVGDWKFEIHDMPRESQRDFARPFEQASGERIGVRFRLIMITTGRSSNVSLDYRKTHLEGWQTAIADFLEGEGFRNLTRQEFASTPFRNTDAMRDFMVKHMPYGSSEFASRTLGPHLVVLVDDDDARCNKIAEVIVGEPEEGVKNDHGGMGLMAFTIGSCRDDGGPDEVLDPLIQQETERLKKEVKQP
jgi:hypothetical protein